MRFSKARKPMLWAVAVVSGGLSAHMLLLDGVLASMLCTPDTQFAAGYSPLAFMRVRAGMGQDEVVKLLGEPLEKTVSSTYGARWRYSRSAADSHHHLRTVRFSDAGVVTDVFHEYYVD